MMPSRPPFGVRAGAEIYCGKIFEMFLTRFFSDGDANRYNWLPMGSPWAFIHSGMWGGTLPASGVAAKASLPASPETIAPPASVLPSANICLRDKARSAATALSGANVRLVAMLFLLPRCARRCRLPVSAHAHLVTLEARPQLCAALTRERWCKRYIGWPPLDTADRRAAFCLWFPALFTAIRFQLELRHR